MKSAVVVVSFKMKGDGLVLRNLCSGVSCVQGDHPDESAVCYALYLLARDKVHKNFSEESKSKVTSLHVAHQSGELLIHAECDSSLTVVRKCIAAILAGLNPARAKSGYRAAIRMLGCSYSEDAFEAAATHAMDGLKNVHVFVGGKGVGSKNGDKSKVQESLETAAKKFDPESPNSKGAARSIKCNANGPTVADTYFISKKGDPSAVVCAFLYLADMPGVHTMDGKIIVNKSLETQVSKLGDKGDLVKKQIEKLMTLESPAHSLASIAGRHGLVSGSELVEIADSKITSGLSSGVTKLF
jgi:hypothetical protein